MNILKGVANTLKASKVILEAEGQKAEYIELYDDETNTKLSSIRVENTSNKHLRRKFTSYDDTVIRIEFK